MGLDTIPDRQDGQTIDQTWYNVLRSALTLQFAPRNAQGFVANGAGSMGTSTNYWKDIYARALKLSANDNLIGLKANAAQLANYGLKLPAALPGTAKLLSVDASGNLIFDDSGTETNYAISSSCGTFIASVDETTTARQQPTNLSVTITTNGRPVIVGLIDDGSGGGSDILSHFVTNPLAVNFYLMRNAIDLTDFYVELTNSVFDIPPGSIHTIDFPLAGTYTYKFQFFARVLPSTPPNTGELHCYNLKLIAYEV